MCLTFAAYVLIQGACTGSRRVGFEVRVLFVREGRRLTFGEILRSGCILESLMVVQVGAILYLECNPLKYLMKNFPIEAISTVMVQFHPNQNTELHCTLQA